MGEVQIRGPSISLAPMRCIYFFMSIGPSIPLIWPIQSTPVISRLLGAKIRECELSGSPVISRCRAKATTREFRITDPYSQAFTTLKQYVE